MRKASNSAMLCMLCLAVAVNFIAPLSAAAQTSDGVQTVLIPVDSVAGMSARTSLEATTRGKPLADGPADNGASAAAPPQFDTIPFWSNQFTYNGFDRQNNPKSVWPYKMVGRAPETGRTTVFGAPIVPMSLDLLAKDGTVAVLHGHPLSFNTTPDLVHAVLESPVFEPWIYTSGIGQITDQMMRAEFWNRIPHGDGDAGRDEESDNERGWHNILAPSVKTARHMGIPFGQYAVFVDAAGNPVAADVDFGTFATLLFPQGAVPDNGTPIGAAEVAGDITTRDISTFLFNNVFLFQGGDPNNCCVGGFHDVDNEPGDASNGNRPRRYVLNFSSWSRPGFFFAGPEDVTALSHELAETFNDPFGDNLTPWWLTTDRIFGNICQDNLEVGDVIEVKNANQVFPISMNGRTYHPQNEALFQWFAFQSPSSAHLGAYSFPDETTLRTLSPGPLMKGCAPPK